MFVEGLSARDHREVLDRVAELRGASNEARRIRDTFGAKKLSEVKRRQLKAALREFEGSVRDALHALPLRDAWLTRLISSFRRAGEEVEQCYASLDALGRKHGVPIRGLRRRLREARGDESAQTRLAVRMNLSIADLLQLDREVRTFGRRILRQQKALDAPADRILQWLEIAREWDARRASRLARDSGGGRTFVQLESLVARIDDVASRAVLRTELPKRRNTAAPAPRWPAAFRLPGVAPRVRPHRDVSPRGIGEPLTSPCSSVLRACIEFSGPTEPRSSEPRGDLTVGVGGCDLTRRHGCRVNLRPCKLL